MARQPRRFVPRLETFDERTLPSVTVSYSPTDGLLLVRGDRASDVITITDTGKGDFGSVTVFDHGTAIYFSEGPVTRIQVLTYGGNDTVDYWLTSDLTCNRTVWVDLGARNDAFTAHLDHQNLGGACGLLVQAFGRGGKDRLALDAHQVNLGDHTSLTVDFQGGRGRDAVAFNYQPAWVDPTAEVILSSDQ
jgi:VCBS repeat-containing protein